MQIAANTLIAPNRSATLFSIEDISTEIPILEIKNRRYYGNKYKLLDFIEDAINKYVGEEWKSFFDLFAGTGVVGNHFNSQEKIIYANDYLFHNYISLHCWLATSQLNNQKLKEIISYLNNIKGFSSYINKNFGGKFFSIENAKKMDAIREEIESMKMLKEINKTEYYILLTSFFYGADKCANIITQYEAYLKNFSTNLMDDKGRQVTYHGAIKPFAMRLPKINVENNQNNKVFREDANKLLREFDDEIDILYLDPPYSSRQYCDNYHLLENITLWNKPEVFGVAEKMNTRELKSNYSKRDVKKTFSDLISVAVQKCKYIVLSYSNRGIMTHEEIYNTLKNISRKKVMVLEKDYNGCHLCTSKIDGNKEKLFIVKP